jgi:hypothetical protein
VRKIPAPITMPTVNARASTNVTAGFGPVERSTLGAGRSLTSRLLVLRFIKKAI